MNPDLVRRSVLAVLVGICQTLAAHQAIAADAAGNFAVRGAGLIDCATFLDEKERKSEAYIMIGGWLDGYLTGVNELVDQTYDITPYQSTELLITIVENHCRTHGTERLFTVLRSIGTQLHDERIDSASELVNINVDGRRVRLYRETIRRMQTKLAQTDLYTGETSGQFDSATLAAIEAYQDRIGYEPSGFPDQATLWKLFTE